MSKKFIIICEVDSSGTTHTKIDLTGYSILESRDHLARAIQALKSEYSDMIKHHFPHKIPYLKPGEWLYDGLVLQVLDKNPNWEKHD